jgi:hypothetical protein
MRTASLCAAAALLLAASPALATSTIHCRTGARGPDLWLSISNDTRTGLFAARIVDGATEVVTDATRGGPRIVRSFVNPRRLSLRVASGGARGVLASLAAARRGTPYVGTFTWRGRTWPVRCFWDEDDPG